MKMKLFLLVLLMAGICSFKSFGQTPLEVNNQMAGITDSLFQKGTVWGTKLVDIFKGSKDYTPLQSLRYSVERYIDEQNAKLNSMQDISGSYELRQAMLSYLQFEKQFAEDQFKPFEFFTPQTNDDVVKAQIGKLEDSAKIEKDYLDKIQVQQEAYAKANNFTINKGN